MNTLSFCTGYGGIELGLKMAGVSTKTLAYCEIEAYAAANLISKMESDKIEPAPLWTNLKTFPAHLFRGHVDLITGGYPCQPFSAAGKRLGADDPRHLWPHILRHIDTIKPVRCFFENVEGHISLGLSSVIADLEERGYKTAWGIFSAAEVGAPHRRKRVFIMGDSEYDGLFTPAVTGGDETPSHDNKERTDTTGQPTGAGGPRRGGGVSGELADHNGSREPQQERGERNEWGRTGDSYAASRWPAEPDVGRVVDGCADRVDRIRLLGNGVVPQTAAKAWQVLSDELK